MSEVTNAAEPTTTATATTTEAKPAEAQAAPASSQAAPEAKAGDNGSGTEAKPATDAAVVPEKYELKLPEGSQLDASWVEKIAEKAKERGLSQDQAQAELEMLHSYEQGQRNLLHQKSEQWLNEVKADKEIGGAAFAQNVEIAKRAVDTFCDPEIKQFLNDTGLGNHPGLVRLFYKIGSKISNDTLVQAPANTAGQQKSIADLFYGQKT